MAILNKLYEIAETIWQKMTRKVHGSFRANEITKNIGKAFFWGEGIDFDQPFRIEVDSFSCELTAAYIFHFVSKFESIAGIGKNAHQFVYQIEDSKEVGSVRFQATKDMAELCDFVYKNACLASMMSIFIDAEKNRLVATDSHKILAMPITITQKSGDTNNLFINAKAWKKMCAKMKAGKAYELEAVKLNDHEGTTVVKFDGLTSYEPFSCRFPNWASCLGKVYDGYCAHVGGSWQAICKMIRSCNNEEHVYLSGEKGEKLIQVKVGENVATFAADEVLKHSFNLGFGVEHLLAVSQMNVLYLGTDVQFPKMAVGNNGNIYLICPLKDADSYIGEMVADGVYDAGNPGEGMSLLQNACEITGHSVSEKKTASSSEKKVLSSKNKIVSSGKKKTVDNSRKFTFEAIGIKPGTMITFIHGGQQVITTSDNRVEYQGKIYTLSGFCKEFMPDDRRNKANSYRGCAFFSYDGVKLEKMFKEALKAKDTVETKDKDVLIEKTCENVTIEAMITADVPAMIKEEAGTIPSVEKGIVIMVDIPLHDGRFKPVCGYHPVLLTMAPPKRDKGIGVKEIRHLVGVATKAIPPPG